MRIITRTIYSLAGQATVVRVTGDPDPANNGRFYLYSDHLGSASAIQKDGSDPNESLLTDRGFTGQRENGCTN